MKVERCVLNLLKKMAGLCRNEFPDHTEKIVTMEFAK